ncbi:hypothetical protein [Mycobacterium sp. RTGN5]|uniref:WXG100 family type VII secretion target n=1 Tax=Mycobacterium sp. RTGN5 TaxID=3016522 RepID=UPI0029C745DE|nr:hypothetical protein [Mycobacterium sp. RTGN5]
MSLSLADIERWDVSSINAVASAADGQGKATRAIADQLGMIVDGIRWDGNAADGARAAMGRTRQELYSHADKYQSVAQAASRSAPQVADLKQEWHAIQDEAAAWGVTIDTASGEVSWHVYAGQSAAEQAIVEDVVEEIVAHIVGLRRRAEQIDAELATAIDSADVQALGFGTNGDVPLSPGFDEVRRRGNQIEAFRKAFGRDPVSPADWDTAAALDPTSYDPKNHDVPANVVVGRIKPVPGQGVVRTNLFIPGETAATPFGDNLGDARGFDPTAAPEESRVTFYVDYENGIVVARQNPSVKPGTGAEAGTPDIRVSQNPNGSVLIDYKAVDPFSPGGEDLGKSSPWNVNGRLVIKPADAGPIAGGVISDFPAIEIYNDRDGATRLVDRIMPLNVGPYGPFLGLPLSQQIGPGLMGEFPDDVYLPPPGLPVHPPSGFPAPHVSLPPATPTPPLVIPYPSVELGPVDQQVKVPVGK